ncbi:single-stranded DNA-binding protein [Patescibacteria group bacterium]
MDLNKAMIIGNVTRDPEVRTTPNGQNVASFGVATNLVWTDQSGEKQQKTEFHNVVAWRKLADICAQYLTKGKKVYVEGRIETQTWEDKESGAKRNRTEIVADNMIMLSGGPSGGGAPAGDAPKSEAPAADAGKDKKDATQSEANGEEEINIEDIPF